MLTRTTPRYGIGALRRFVRAQPLDLCEFCGKALPDEHQHLVEVASRRVMCTCLFCGEALAGRSDRAFRLVPREAAAMPDFRMSDAEWHGLGLPIDMAFVFQSTPAGAPVAFYPGPLGATEALPSPEAWAAIVARNPVLAEFEPDVEALLINRVKGRRAYYRAPIDRCYALVGLIRKNWRGFSGGDEVWDAIDGYFTGIGDRHAASSGGRA